MVSIRSLPQHPNGGEKKMPAASSVATRREDVPFNLEARLQQAVLRCQLQTASTKLSEEASARRGSPHRAGKELKSSLEELWKRSQLEPSRSAPPPKRKRGTTPQAPRSISSPAGGQVSFSEAPPASGSGSANGRQVSPSTATTSSGAARRSLPPAAGHVAQGASSAALEEGSSVELSDLWGDGASLHSSWWNGIPPVAPAERQQPPPPPPQAQIQPEPPQWPSLSFPSNPSKNNGHSQVAHAGWPSQALSGSGGSGSGSGGGGGTFSQERAQGGAASSGEVLPPPPTPPQVLDGDNANGEEEEEDKSDEWLADMQMLEPIAFTYAPQEDDFFRGL
eukprot:jgi/Mesen1/3604/ME000020S03130